MSSKGGSGGHEACVDEDVVGLSLWGSIEVEPIVAQGCRSVGGMYEVMESKGGTITKVIKVDKQGAQGEAIATMMALRDVLQTLEPKVLCSLPRALSTAACSLEMAPDSKSLEERVLLNAARQLCRLV